MIVRCANFTVQINRSVFVHQNHVSLFICLFAISLSLSFSASQTWFMCVSQPKGFSLLYFKFSFDMIYRFGWPLFCELRPFPLVRIHLNWLDGKKKWSRRMMMALARCTASSVHRSCVQALAVSSLYLLFFRLPCPPDHTAHIRDHKRVLYYLNCKHMECEPV